MDGAESIPARTEARQISSLASLMLAETGVRLLVELPSLHLADDEDPFRTKVRAYEAIDLIPISPLRTLMNPS